MLLVGLTGGIGSGKSTVSGMLAERGAEVIDADHIAREVVMPCTPAWCKIRDHFGPGVLYPDGSIDRQALADIVFGDPGKLALLNEITHPAIFERIAERLEAAHDRDAIVVLDAALLIETGLAQRVDVLLVAHSPKEVQVERLAAKGMASSQAKARIAAQLAPEERLARADLVIDNTGSLEDLGRQVDDVWRELERRLAEQPIMAADREAVWPTDWTDPATQREFWFGFYISVLDRLGHSGDRQELAGALYETFTDPASYRLFEDSRPALEALAARGLKLGIISNFEPWLEDVLRLEGVRELFSVLAISGVLGVAKPQPAIFQTALDKAGVEPGAAIHVGDHPDVDGAAARAVGITPVLIDRFRRLPPAAGPRIRSLTELVELVDAEA